MKINRISRLCLAFFSLTLLACAEATPENVEAVIADGISPSDAQENGEEVETAVEDSEGLDGDGESGDAMIADALTEDTTETEDKDTVEVETSTGAVRIPLGAKGSILDMHAVNSQRIYASGENGTLLRWNAEAWIPQDAGTQENLNGVWGIGSEFAIAVGNGGTVVVFDGTHWTVKDIDVAVDLFGVHGFAENDVYIVGDNGYIGHWDGTQWTSQISNVNSPLRTVWGPSSSVVFAGGDQARVLRRTNGVWVSSAAAASSVTIQGLWGTGSSDMFAVGTKGTLARWNGTGWKAMVSNDFDLRDLYGIWGSSGDNIYAVGDAGMILKYVKDSDDWEVVIVKGPLNKFTDLRAVAGFLDPSAGLTNLKQTRGFAAGVGAQFLEVKEGNWVDSEGRLAADLHDVWVTDSVATAVGAGGTIVRRKSAGWAGEPSGVQEDLFSVAGNGSALVSVGAGGTILTREFGEWVPMDSPTEQDLYGVVAAGDDWLAVGAKGTILRWAEEWGWMAEDSGVIYPLNDIWVDDDGSAFAVGDKGTILYSPGNGEWGKVPSGTSSDLEAVHGHAGKVWAVGNWTIVRGNAAGFSVEATFSSDYLYGVWASPSGSVKAAGWAGLLVDGGEGLPFEEVSTGVTEVLESVMGISDEDYFAVGRNGVLVRYRQNEN